ncbi:MAG: glycosyltransferase family 2 protein [Deltaproteobacteria bacterium]|nr:glycosyltransferase family 2 protein [Deltaproteobacteria bacterium]
MTTRAPAVSWLIPIQNAEDTLAEALSGVLAQRHAPDFEVVCVDDASRDRTPELLADFARADPRIRIIKGQGTGLVDALNLGFAHCTGDLVARMDADDLVSPDRLSLQCAYLRDHPGCAGVGSRVRLWPQPLTQGAARFQAFLDDTLTHEQLHAARFIESPLVHPTLTLRREVLQALHGWRDLGFAEDWDLVLRLLHGGHRLAKVPEVLLDWRDRPQRLTRTGSAYRAEQHMRLRAYHLANGPLKNRAFDLWGAGPTGKRLLRALESHGLRPRKVFDIDPRKHVARGVTITPGSDIRPPDGTLLLCAVGAASAHESLRAALEPVGYREDDTYIFCA